MADYKQSDLTISTYERLFNGEGKNGDGIATDVYELPLSLIDDFPNNPYKVRDDEDMAILTDSIRERGLITPALVRQKPDGRYEIVSGHRRKFACIKLGLATMKCTVVEISQDEAAMILVESNFQRTEIFPTEKGYAYRLRLEAMRRIAGRPPKDNCDTMCHNYSSERSVDVLAKEAGESRGNVQKYIRLTYLVPRLQQLVNERKIAVTAGATISFISEKYQYEVCEIIERTKRFPSIAEAKRLRNEYAAREKAEAEANMLAEKAKLIIATTEDTNDDSIAKSKPIHDTDPTPCRQGKTVCIHKWESDPISTKPALSVYEDEQKKYPNYEPFTESKDEPSTAPEETPDTVVESEIVISSETVRRYFNDFGSIENMEAFIRKSLDDNHKRVRRQREQENDSIPAETEE